MSLRATPDSERSTLTLHDGDVVAFGRGATCGLRFGHAPRLDESLARVCGWLVVANGRIVVHAAERSPENSAAVIKRPVIVSTEQAPPRLLGGGEMWGPNAEIFTIEVTGDEDWTLDVVNFRDLPTDSDPGLDPPSRLQRVELDDELWAVLHAYAEPVLRGERFPATHDQVAAAINWNRMTARRRLERIYDEFYLRRITMPEVSDMRIRVVEAAISHGLIG